MQTIRRELRIKFNEVLHDEALSERLADIALEVAGFQKREDKVQQAISSANVKVDAMIAFAKEEKWAGREKMPEPIRDLLDVFVEVTGIKPTRGQINGWLADGSDWVEIGAKAGDIRAAYEKSRGDPVKGGGFFVGRPGSLTTTIQAIVGERRKDKNKSSSLADFITRYNEEHPNG